ncbi:zinc-alpha-2-glycoprotein-like [Pipistrellus kuhlii]|uniref:zinc-alpha-2-glycoprotein-like n=1 Tax=Pipistrellus kuhlii TaxID=59472 RepID=UPI00174F67B2|nr:zinc-alpha-2-glycoprotein-like [Pipistrellus kuhlii]
MSTMVPFLLSLLLVVGPAVSQDTQNNAYSLSFHYTGVSRPEAGMPSFQATGFLNDQAFLHYDSKSKTAEPLGPWKQVDGMVNWEEESQLQQDRQDIFMQTLRDVMGYHRDRGNHTFKGTFGCEIRNDSYCRSFWKYAYDGEDYIEFNTEIPAWIPLQPKALNTKVKWETEGSVQESKKYLEMECPHLLRSYLQFSRPFLDRQDPPSASITSHVTLGLSRTLKCVASNFYPQPINLYWTQGANVVETKLWGDDPISENGTYQSWELLRTFSLDKGPYSCHVQHSSLAQPLIVTWDGTQ